MKRIELSAPRIDRLIESTEKGIGIVDKNILELIRPIIETMERIEVQDDDETRKVWFEAPRGDIADFGDYNEYLEDGEVDDHDDFIELWQGYYPNPTKWYRFNQSKYQENYYFTIGPDTYFQTGIPVDENKIGKIPRELLLWIRSKAEETMDKLVSDEEGYNKYVEEKLPHEKRFGKVLRSDLWEVFPKERDQVRGDLSDKDIEKLEGIISEPIKTIEKMTAGSFYDICRICYLANGYERVTGPNMTAREMYRVMADGRDCGLGEIDLDSEEAFLEWHHHGSHCGGHPFEICSGGNSTHISLYVHRENDGWRLTLVGSSRVRVLETVKMALALNKHGIPFELHESHEILRMLKGIDYVGIVPDWMTPRYCSSDFPSEERIHGFMNLWHEYKEIITEKATWYPLEKVRLRISK
ncbi:MAG: hypothetical protein QCI82_00985 [Candidatus Thermoplasmatota archaeon]|nr:hypothetical protein [Candidatus Thermoplasmatota archaeon]